MREAKIACVMVVLVGQLVGSGKGVKDMFRWRLIIIIKGEAGGIVVAVINPIDLQGPIYCGYLIGVPPLREMQMTDSI